ncbi:MAG: hypothetical protein ABSF29_08580 [Tepidisphaeraceae bacterium]|jgi:TolB-like protein
MRSALLLSAVLALGVSSAMADVPAATAPDTAAASANAPAAPTVLVLPFQQTGDTSNFGWIAPAIQENLLGQVAQTGFFQAVSSNRVVGGGDNATALQAAHEGGANIVIFGAYQVVAGQIRIDAQIVDVASAHTIGTLQATGAVPDLFKMEDSLSAQLHQLLPTPPPSADLPTITYGTPNSPPAQVADATAPAPVAASPYTDNSYYSAPYAYTYAPPAYYTPVYVYPYYAYGNYCGPSTFYYFNYRNYSRYPGHVWHYGGIAGPHIVQGSPGFGPAPGMHR